MEPVFGFEAASIHVGRQYYLDMSGSPTSQELRQANWMTRFIMASNFA